MNDNKNQTGYDEKEIDTANWIAGYTIPDSSTSSTTEKEESGQSRALEICAMLFGILSIIACCCYGVFGLIGLVLSIIGLVKGKKSGMTITGLVCSIIGLLLSVLVMIAWESNYLDEVRNAYEQYNAEKDYAMQSEDGEKANWEEYLNQDTETVDNEISSSESGEICLEGNTFRVPCKVSELLKYYEVSDYSKDDLKKELEPGDTSTIFLATNGVQNGISLFIENKTDSDITDIGEATVYCISVVSDSEYAISDVSIYNGIAFGMSAEEVKSALEGVQYEENEMNYGEDIYTFYNFDAGDAGEYSISIMLAEDAVISVDIFVY